MKLHVILAERKDGAKEVFEMMSDEDFWQNPDWLLEKFSAHKKDNNLIKVEILTVESNKMLLYHEGTHGNNHAPKKERDMTLKYIMIDYGFPIISIEGITHEDMAGSFKERVTSAGFCRINSNKSCDDDDFCQVWGESKSLKMAVSEGDEFILARMFKRQHVKDKTI